MLPSPPRCVLVRDLAESQGRQPTVDATFSVCRVLLSSLFSCFVVLSPVLSLLPLVFCVCLQMVADLKKALTVAEKDARVYHDRVAPLEASIAECRARLELAVGTVQLGSAIQLDDIDELARREREQVRVGVGE